MKLEERIDKLESRQGQAIWHIHYDEPGWDARRDCEKCAALTDEEFARLRSDPNVRIVTIETYSDPIGHAQSGGN